MSPVTMRRLATGPVLAFIVLLRLAAASMNDAGEQLCVFLLHVATVSNNRVLSGTRHMCACCNCVVWWLVRLMKQKLSALT
jgi:hypothetical protein